MILTQRQIEQIIKAHGRVVIPYRARLTPSAQDFVRHNKLQLHYDEIKLDFSTPSKPTAPHWESRQKFLWWSDGPDGIAKAALGMSARDVALEPMPILEDPSRSISAIRTLTQSIDQKQAHGAILIVKNAGPTTVLANKAPNLRAIVATTMANVEEAIATIAANVLIIERGTWALHPLKNLITRFCKLERQIERVVEDEVSSLSPRPIRSACGGCSGCPCAGGVR